MSEKQSAISKIKSFSNEKILLLHSLSDYRIDLYFPKDKLAIEVDEKEHTDRDEKKKKRKKDKRKTWL